MIANSDSVMYLPQLKKKNSHHPYHFGLLFSRLNVASRVFSWRHVYKMFSENTAPPGLRISCRLNDQPQISCTRYASFLRSHNILQESKNISVYSRLVSTRQIYETPFDPLSRNYSQSRRSRPDNSHNSERR